MVLYSVIRQHIYFILFFLSFFLLFFDSMKLDYVICTRYFHRWSLDSKTFRSLRDLPMYIRKSLCRDLFNVDVIVCDCLTSWAFRCMKINWLLLLYVCVCSFPLFDKSLLSDDATMLLMLLFLILHSLLACDTTYRFLASSPFRAVQLYCILFMYIILVLTLRK